MTAKCQLLMIMCACPVVAITASPGRAAPPESLVTFVETAATDLSSSSLQIPQFRSAKIDAVEDLGKANGTDRYLCWLKSDTNRVGYIAVAGSGQSFHVLAFSATIAPPEYFLVHLQAPQLGERPLDFARVNELSSIAHVPLVAATPTFLGTEPFEISEIAASMSSVFNFWQREKRMLLFPHAGFEASVSDPEYTRRFSENPASTQRPQDPTWVSFPNECDAARAQIDIPRGQTTEQKCVFAVRAHSVIKPIVRRRLLDPINAQERMEVLEGERASLDGVARMNISSRMRDAILLQLDYLDSNVENIERDIELFFKTRGRTARIQGSPFEQARMDTVPVVVIGPANLAGVVLGYIDIGGERFASVFLPRTGSPIIKSLAQKTAEARKASGFPEPNWTEEINRKAQVLREAQEKIRRAYEEKGLVYDPPEKSLEQEFREGMERIRVGYEQTLVVEDHDSASSLDVDNGIHLVRCSAMASWRTMYVGEIGLDTNWGRSAKR